MKKSLFLIFALLLCSQSVSAQKSINVDVIPLYRNEIAASYGFLTHTNIGDPATSTLMNIISGHKIRMSHLGGFNLQYMHALSNKLYIGGAVTYEIGKSKDGQSALAPKISGNYITIMPTLKYYWYDSKHFGVYSRVGGGVTISSYGITPQAGRKQSTVRADMAFQASALCIEAGAQWIRGFLECGYGSQGVLLAGVKYCF
ncbi:MAG: hypothetical protein J1E33_01420 [Alistipes sp.]|nr:hypothetical protein [Alistipes sp.]